MDKTINNIKKLFMVGALILALAITGGSYLFKSSTKFSDKNIAQNLAYIKYKVLYFNGNKNTQIKDIPADTIPVFVYHGIVKNADRFSMTQKRFAEQMEILKKNGYQTVTMEDLYHFMYDRKSLPDKSFVLTFDDGRKDSYYGADPILKVFGYRAVMFTATGVTLPEDKNKDSIYYLNEEEIQRMNDSGRWDIQSHAVQNNGGFVTIDSAGAQGNFLSNKAWLKNEQRLENEAEYEKRVTEELVNSKKTIDEQLNKTVIALSYPFGDYGQQSVNISHEDASKFINKLLKENYKLAFRQIWPVDHEFSQNSPTDDPYFLKRIEPSPEWTGQTFINMVISGKTKSMPFEDTFAFNSGWRNLWGEMNISNNILETRAGVDTSGSFNILDGTLPWKNYLYTSVLDWKNGSHVSLVARYQDSGNYVTCTFSDTQVRIEERIDGKIKKVVDSKINLSFSKEKLALSISVFDNKVKCYIGDKKVSETFDLQSTMNYGGIGIKTWDEKNNISDVATTLVSVKNVTNKTVVLDLLKSFRLKTE